MSIAELRQLLPVSPTDLQTAILERRAIIGIVGMGYVGQPLALAAHVKGFKVIGFDVDPAKVKLLNQGQTSLKTIDHDAVRRMYDSGNFRATSNLYELSQPDVIVICVPTPIDKHQEPDLSFIVQTAESISAALRPGQLVCLESTTYPGTTTDVVKPILEKTGLRVGRDIFLAFSPEREDPGNKDFTTADIPKVVGADDDGSRMLAEAFYGAVAKRIVPVSSSATAEAAKLTENIFRCVNIALVNELKHIFADMDINVWEVIKAAASKPFGFMPFYPGPGLGGHCIPIDPFYLSWKAREYDIRARFIELAGEVNAKEPANVVRAVQDALSVRRRLSMHGARVLLMGLSYKKNVDDLRESPSLAVMRRLEQAGAVVSYYDPWIPTLPATREYPEFEGRVSIAWAPESFADRFDVAVITTDHDDVDYADLVQSLELVVDTRNATHGVQEHRERIVLA